MTIPLHRRIRCYVAPRYISRISLLRDWQVKENVPAAPVLPASRSGGPRITELACRLCTHQPGPVSWNLSRPGVPPMNLHDLESRVDRLDQLSRGLAMEEILWKECNGPLLYRDRQDYLAA